MTRPETRSKIPIVFEGQDVQSNNAKRKYSTPGENVNMNAVAAIQDEQHHRLEVKLKRELGEHILELLGDVRTEDILLNPDCSLWVKRMGEGFHGQGKCPRPRP